MKQEVATERGILVENVLIKNRATRVLRFVLWWLDTPGLVAG